jgi:hypothetical protein
MLKFIIVLLALASSFTNATNDNYTRPLELTQIGITPLNNCVQFSVSSGTGCAWMCNYCANSLGTFNYYFTDNVCTYETGGCVGNPIAGKTYTCCSV